MVPFFNTMIMNEDQELVNWLTRPQDEIDSFSVVVKKFFTTVDGTIIDKNDPQVPVDMRVRYPIYLFGTFDQNGAYKISLNETPVQGGSRFYRYYTESEGFDPLQFSGLNTVENQISTGDLVFVFTDDLLNPNLFVYVIQTVTNRSIAGITRTLPWGGLQLGKLKLFYDNLLNFNEQIRLIKSNQLGIYRSDTFAPLAYKTPNYQQDNLIDIDLSGNLLTQYMTFTTYMQHDSDTLEFDFEFLNIS